MDQDDVKQPASPVAATGPEPTPAIDSATPAPESADDRKADRLRLAFMSGPTRLLLPLALAVGVIYGMKYAGDLLNPIFLALFLTMGVSPALYWMRRKGLPPWLCVLIISVATVILIILFALVLLTAVTQLNDKLPVYSDNLGTMLSGMQDWFAGHGIDISALTKETLTAARILGLVGKFLTSIVGVFGSLFWLILIFIFMVTEAYSFPGKMRLGHMDKTLARSFANFSQVTRDFLFTKGWLSGIMAFLVAMIYWGFGIDFALVWGVMFFLLSFVPNIGFVLSVIPPLAVGILEFGWLRAVIAVAVVIVANTVVDNVISPRIMGKTVGLSTLTVFLSVFFWGWVLGGIGALMSVPLTLMVKLLFFDSFDSTRVISEIMATPLRELGKRRRGGRFHKKSGKDAEPEAAA